MNEAVVIADGSIHLSRQSSPNKQCDFYDDVDKDIPDPYIHYRREISSLLPNSDTSLSIAVDIQSIQDEKQQLLLCSKNNSSLDEGLISRARRLRARSLKALITTPLTVKHLDIVLQALSPVLESKLSLSTGLAILQEPPIGQVLIIPPDGVSTAPMYIFSIEIVNMADWSASGPVQAKLVLDGEIQPNTVLAEEIMEDDGTCTFTDLYRILCEDSRVIKNHDLGVCVSVQFEIDVVNESDSKQLVAETHGRWYRPCLSSVMTSDWTNYTQAVLWQTMVAMTGDDAVTWPLVSNMLQTVFIGATGQSLAEPRRPIAAGDLNYIRDRFAGHADMDKASFEQMFHWMGPILTATCSTKTLVSRLWYEGYIVGFMSRQESSKWLSEGLKRVTDKREGFLLRFGQPTDHFVMSAVLPGQRPSEDNIKISLRATASAISAEIDHLHLGWWMVCVDERYLVRGANDCITKLKGTTIAKQTAAPQRTEAQRRADLSNVLDHIGQTWAETESKLVAAKQNYQRLIETVKREVAPLRIFYDEISDLAPYTRQMAPLVDYLAFEGTWRGVHVLVKKLKHPNADKFTDDFLIHVASLKSRQSQFLGACWGTDAMCEIWEMRYSDPAILKTNSDIGRNLIQVQSTL